MMIPDLTLPKCSDPLRRRLLKAIALGVGPPLVAAGSFGFLSARARPRLKEVTIVIPDLPSELCGLRIVQLSDIHLSQFVRRSQLAAAVDMANELHADLAVITGDLITASGDPLDDCLSELGRLRGAAGVYGCLGNHEIYAGAEEYATRKAAKLGIRFLRGQSQLLRFGNSKLNLAGVDYQQKGRPYLPGTGELLRKDAVNILLSHNPDVFPIAADQGWELTLSGHTHGGQVTLEYLHPMLNPARFMTPYIYGIYRRQRSSIFVTAGMGTVNLPVRLGVPPEIALVRLSRG